ncbi:MAG TPA: type II toxin-antitoxin system RelE/ParE family toxin [Burkholderiales bacterium]|nr:type II toxin-antitoxin system RelE/ParE family toxin [Burkholderiales bacterium]
MAVYRLAVKASAAKELDAVEPKRLRQRLVAAIADLADNPRPAGCEKLAGAEDAYRIRQGDYRAVYAIDDSARVVLVVKVGHRREVYR